MRNFQEIQEQVKFAGRLIESGETTQTKKSYEDGVKDSLVWALGESHDAPLGDVARTPQTA